MKQKTWSRRSRQHGIGPAERMCTQEIQASCILFEVREHSLSIGSGKGRKNQDRLSSARLFALFAWGSTRSKQSTAYVKKTSVWLKTWLLDKADGLPNQHLKKNLSFLAFNILPLFWTTFYVFVWLKQGSNFWGGCCCRWASCWRGVVFLF